MNRAILLAALVGCGLPDDGPAADPTVDPNAIVGTHPAPGTLTPPANVVAWFSFETTVGFGMATRGALGAFFGDGYHGGGAYMDGHTQYAILDTTEYDTSLDFAGAFSVAMWLRPERLPADFEVIASRSVGSGTESAFALAIDSSLRLRYDSQGGASLVGSTPLVLNEWTHVAMTFDGATKRVFVNGVLDASGPAAGPVTWDHRYILFGADEESSYYSGGHHLEGHLDDAMLFGRAVSADELAAFVAQ